jgi:photosynthetic reaction center M subunit
MAEYQNIFNQVQVSGPAELGVDETGLLAKERTKATGNYPFLGILGNAQLGPIHLGMFGVISLYLGLVWFFASRLWDASKCRLFFC